MWEPRRLTIYGPSRLVTGIVLPLPHLATSNFGLCSYVFLLNLILTVFNVTMCFAPFAFYNLIYFDCYLGEIRKISLNVLTRARHTLLQLSILSFSIIRVYYNRQVSETGSSSIFRWEGSKVNLLCFASR
jgi:hypothetical protein